MSSKTVVITGAAGRIAYSLIPLIAGGEVFGPHVRISLHLVDIAAMEEKLKGIQMEIEDSGYPLIDSIVTTSDTAIGFKDVDVAVLLGGSPRGPGMERSEMIGINAKGIAQQAKDLETYAHPDVKVLVVANPANTNCLVAISTATKIPAKNFSCLTRLDHERLRGMASKHFKTTVKDVAIWGNHSQTQVPYLDVAVISSADGKSHFLKDLSGYSEFLSRVTPQVQGRGAEIIKHTGGSSALSAAAAVGRHLTDWTGAAGAHDIFSMGVISDGNTYGIPPGIVFSFPCRHTSKGAIEIVPDLPISSEVRAMLDRTIEELVSEKADAEAIITSASKL